MDFSFFTQSIYGVPLWAILGIAFVGLAWFVLSGSNKKK